MINVVPFRCTVDLHHDIRSIECVEDGLRHVIRSIEGFEDGLRHVIRSIEGVEDDFYHDKLCRKW